MSYAVSEALQTALYQELTGDTLLGEMVGSAIYDALPSGTLPALYVTLGPERVRSAGDSSGTLERHDVSIAVVTTGAGFAQAKAAAGRICDVLAGAELALSRGVLIALRFTRARARRTGTGETRQIDLIFRAEIDDAA